MVLRFGKQTVLLMATCRPKPSAPYWARYPSLHWTKLTILSKNSKGSRENYRPIAIAFDGEIEEHEAVVQQVLQLTKIIFESVKNLPTASARARFELSAGCPSGFDRGS
jgi:hypothetical protein